MAGDDGRGGFHMTCGYFDDERKEYVIRTPRTPWPWINYLGTGDFCSLISNCGGGYSFYRDALHRRITRYRHNNIPADVGARAFWVRETDGSIWSPCWKPSQELLDKYECRHGLGYTLISGWKYGLEASILFTVPLDRNAELQRVTITNHSKSMRNISFYSYVEFALWNAQDDGENFQRNLSIGEVEISDSTIIHKTGYRERRNHFSFYHSFEKPDGFDTDRDEFVGFHGAMFEPVMVQAGISGGSVAEGWHPIAAFRHDIALEAGASREISFMLGYAENPRDAKWESNLIGKSVNKTPIVSLINSIGGFGKIEGIMRDLDKHWEQILSRFHILHKDTKLVRMVNIWNQYQCLITYALARSASYFESGIGRGIGFRDSAQDLLGCVHIIPEKSKERIKALASTQMSSGACYHQYQPLTKKGNSRIGTNFRDDPLWLIASVSAYIRESGDWAFLEERVSFDGGKETDSTVFDHLKRSFDYVQNNLGPHGLPLIGRADWNDCLNLNTFSDNPDESFQTAGDGEGGTAESVFIAGMLVYFGRDYVQICQRSGREEIAERALEAISKMENSVKQHGWDGRWYLRAYDALGSPVGTKKSREGKIFIESQGMCAMAEIGAADGMPKIALDSVKEHLDSEHGLTLLWPAFTNYNRKLGEICSYPPGYKENGGVFCHNNPWVIIAETIAGNASRAWTYYKKIAPAWREEISMLHRTEPYVYAQMIAGPESNRYGEAKNSWLTGSAAWNFVALSQHILGIRPHWDGLLIDPCVPADWDAFAVRRFFRKEHYEIRFKNQSFIGTRGIKSITLDGKALDGNIVRPIGDGKSHLVEVLI